MKRAHSCWAFTEQFNILYWDTIQLPKKDGPELIN